MWLYPSEYLGKFEYKNHECLYHQKTLANIKFFGNSFLKKAVFPKSHSHCVVSISFVSDHPHKWLNKRSSRVNFTQCSVDVKFKERERKSSTDFVFTIRNYTQARILWWWGKTDLCWHDCRSLLLLIFLSEGSHKICKGLHIIKLHRIVHRYSNSSDGPEIKWQRSFLGKTCNLWF